MRRPSLLFALLLIGLDAAAAGRAAGLKPGDTATVARVVDGDTLVLADGREVRLFGILAPKPPLGRPDSEPWPLADAAKAALAELAQGRSVSLAFGARRIDRHGRTLAHLHDASGRWIQGEMLARGLARVWSLPDNRDLVAEMLALERRAREARLGLWADPFYRIRAPAEAARAIDTFQLVEGRITASAIVRGRGYLNFGPDWRTDFTLSLDPPSVRLFEAEGVSLDALEGRRVRIRGWIKSFNGPLIEVTHPEQIEVLPE